MAMPQQKLGLFVILATLGVVFPSAGSAQKQVDVAAAAFLYGSGASVDQTAQQGGLDRGALFGGEANLTVLGRSEHLLLDVRLTAFRLAGGEGGEWGMTPNARAVAGVALAPTPVCAPMLVVGGAAGRASTTIQGEEYFVRDDSTLRAGLGASCRLGERAHWLVTVESGYGAAGWGAQQATRVAPVALTMQLHAGRVFAQGEAMWLFSDGERFARATDIKVGVIAAQVNPSFGVAIGLQGGHSQFPHEELGAPSVLRGGVFLGLVAQPGR